MVASFHTILACILDSDWRKIGVRLAYLAYFSGHQRPKTLENQGFYLSTGFIVGNSSTSRMVALSVISMTIRSRPKPRPPVGGIAGPAAPRREFALCLIWLLSDSTKRNANARKCSLFKGCAPKLVHDWCKIGARRNVVYRLQKDSKEANSLFFKSRVASA